MTLAGASGRIARRVDRLASHRPFVRAPVAAPARHALRDRAARGGLGPGGGRGRRRRALRRQVPGRRAGGTRAGGRADRRRAGARGGAAPPGAGPHRDRRRARPQRAAHGDPGAADRQRRAQPGDGLSRRRRRLRRGGAAADRRPAGLADRRAGCLRGQRRPHRAQPEPALAGRRAVAHRSRRRALLAPRLGRARRNDENELAQRRRGRSGASASTCCCRSPISCPPRAPRWRRRSTTTRIARAVEAVPDLWLEGPGDDRLRAAYGTWLRARRAALPKILDEANRVRTSRV